MSYRLFQLVLMAHFIERSLPLFVEVSAINFSRVCHNFFAGSAICRGVCHYSFFKPLLVGVRAPNRLAALELALLLEEFFLLANIVDM